MKKVLFLALSVITLLGSGCVAIPPLINVTHKDEPTDVKSRLDSIESRLGNIEQQLQKK